MHRARGFCAMHYKRLTKWGDALVVSHGSKHRPRRPVSTCRDCDRLAFCKGLCRAHYAKSYRKNGGGRRPTAPQRRRSWLRNRYGLTEAEYDEMLAAQGGLCAICLGEGDRRGLTVDHAHGAGDVRGILCHPCNIALGLLDDSEDRLMMAVSYLRAARLFRAA